VTALDRTREMLVGRRVLLRPLTPDDFKDWADVRNRCEEWLVPWEPRALAGVPNAQTSQLAFSARCEARNREREAGTGYGFGIFINSRFVGEVNLNNVIRGACQNSYIGYWIDQAVAGQGLMPEAVVIVMQYAFEVLGLHRIQIAIIPRNTPSMRVVEKLGLRSEGLAERYLEINGVWEDHIRFAMTVEEWRDRRAELLDAWVD
jgi:ribosomal-protein-alanine N-acetyltransferase